MNVVILKGRIGNDVTIEKKGDKSHLKISLATNDGWGDNKKTNWHNCIMFGKIAEVADKFCKKGDELIVRGRIDYNQHNEKWYTSILVENIEFVGGNKNDNQPTQQSDTATNDNDLPF